MKKLMTMVLALMLLCSSVSAFAAEEFTLRNGIKFGDTMEQVRAKETLQFNEAECDEDSLRVKKGTVAGIDDVEILYNFDETGKLYEALWYLPPRSTSDSSDSDYEKLYKALVKKYGSPLGYSNGDCYIFTGGALEKAVLSYYIFSMLDTGVGDMRDYDEWDVEYGTDDHVKIEICQFYWGSSYSTRKYSIYVGYTHFTDAELEAERNEKEEENAAVMNDI